ncbi:glycosyltransferase family 2 protein [Bradyrhizobium sp. GCM10028915]|uniref:glycosyltransferase family 2 protein n=1 Tax=Bradyrhizobium sp. GCM10028915 TaxID=3273385 RepID=UPI00361CD44C
MTKFSVVLPVRNGWPYVRECVESILAQRYPHFDLVVLDNQSTDNTVPWLKSLRDSRIRLYGSSSPLSIVDSWRRVVGIERQEYMTLIGHDDLLDPGFLETIQRTIERYPDAKLYQTGSRLIDTSGNTIRSCRPTPERETPAQYLQGRFTYKRDITGTGVVMRSVDYDRVGGIPAFERLFFADDALWLSLMQGGYKAFDPNELFSIRMHPKKESTTKPSSWPALLLGLNQFAEFLKAYAAGDSQASVAVANEGTSFMLRYHQNLYILALVEASQSGQRIEPATTSRISESLRNCAPAAADLLRNSFSLRAVEALNAGPLRRTVPLLWGAYHRYWMRAQ